MSGRSLNIWVSAQAPARLAGVDEAALVDKLRKIEALFAGATSDGERVAAGEARARILKRLQASEREDPPLEYRFKLADPWSRRVFVALLRRYGIHPYRYPRQRRTTVMAKVSRGFVDATLWPEFEQLSMTLREHLEQLTDRVVSQVLHQNPADPDVVSEPPRRLESSDPDRSRSHR